MYEGMRTYGATNGASSVCGTSDVSDASDAGITGDARQRYANECNDTTMYAKICMRRYAMRCKNLRNYAKSAKICKKSTKRASQGGIESGHEHGKQRV